MLMNLKKAESLVSKIKPRHLLAMFFLLLAAFIMLWSASRIKEVTVDIDGDVQKIVTAVADPYRVLEKLEIELSPEDRITIEGFGKGGFFGELGQNKASIRIQSAVNIEIAADSLRYHVTVAEGDTVKAGDKIAAAADGALSVAIHAPIDGKITAVSEKYIKIN